MIYLYIYIICVCKKKSCCFTLRTGDYMLQQDSPSHSPESQGDAVVFTGAFHRGERQRGKPRQAPFAAELQTWPPLGLNVTAMRT